VLPSLCVEGHWEAEAIALSICRKGTTESGCPAKLKKGPAKPVSVMQCELCGPDTGFSVKQASTEAMALSSVGLRAIERSRE